MFWVFNVLESLEFLEVLVGAFVLLIWEWSGSRAARGEVKSLERQLVAGETAAGEGAALTSASFLSGLAKTLEAYIMIGCFAL